MLLSLCTRRVGFRGVSSLLCGYLEEVKEKLGPQRISKHTTPKLPRKEQACFPLKFSSYSFPKLVSNLLLRIQSVFITIARDLLSFSFSLLCYE